MKNGAIVTQTNRSGGVQGGITNGMPILFRTAVKPTPSIYREQKTVMTIDQALDAEQKTVRLEEAAGAVSGDYVYLYPPGIPVLVPGEAIDVQTAETIRHCIRLGLEVEGLPDLTCINVVK